MKKFTIGLMVLALLALTSCNLEDISGNWNFGGETVDNTVLAEMIEAEILADVDLDAAIEEEIEIEIPESFAKAAPGPGGNGGNGYGRNRRRIRLMVKQSIDSVDVQKSIEYTSDDTALVTLTKTIMGSFIINQNDTAIVDTPEVWEKDYTYTATSYMQFVQVECADSCMRDSSQNDTTNLRWKLVAKSIQAGETNGLTNTIENVILEPDNDSIAMVFDDPAELYPVIRGKKDWGSYRERPGRSETEVYVTIDGLDDVNVLGSSGRYFKLLDDGEDLDLTADDNIYSGSIMKGRGQGRIRVRMISTATFLDKDAPVELNSWFMPVR